MKSKSLLVGATILLAAVLAGAQPLPNNFWPNSTFQNGTNLSAPDGSGTPTGWARNGSLVGSSNTIDQVTNVTLPDSTHAIMVVNEVGAPYYGEWDSAVPIAGVVSPGDTVNLRYDLMYSVPSGEQMRVALGFLDSSSNYISADQFVVTGDSPGWHGGFNPTFTETNQSAVVPIGTVFINVGVVSGGAPGTQGILVVDDLYVARAPTPQILPGNFWTNSSFESGTNLDQTNGIPDAWNTYNSGPSLITVVTTNNYVSATHAIAVIDNDAANYGSWYSSLVSLSNHAKAGDSLNVQWFQLYSVSNGTMRVTFSFYNAAGNDIDDISYEVTGNSPGWQGSVAGSGFTRVNQSITVPPNATQLLVQLVSGGSGSSTGIMMIDDLSIAPLQTAPPLPGNFWPNSSFSKGTNLNIISGTPTGWARSGSDITMDQVTKLGTNYALTVLDRGTNTHGEWDSDLILSPSNAVPGNLINLQYSALYSVTNGTMRLSVLFFDSSTNQLGETDFNVTGQSPGWNGVISNSTFTVESNQVLVPANAARMRFALVSGGPDSVTGVFLIENLDAAVQIIPPIPATVLPLNFFPNPTFEQGAALDNPTVGIPAGGWLRGGSATVIDQMSTNNSTSPTHSLALVDDDPNNYGEWYLSPGLDISSLVSFNDALDIQWFQIYNVSNGSMRLSFAFLDTNANTLQSTDYNTSNTGTNAGWNGTVAASTFDMVFHQLLVPQGASTLRVNFASGGASSVTGIMLIDDLSVRVSVPNIIDAEFQPGGFLITWNSMPSKNYTVLYSPTLSPPTWTPLSTGIGGNFPTTSYFDGAAHSGSQGYYEIIQQ
jgi:hypothetical protein